MRSKWKRRKSFRVKWSENQSNRVKQPLRRSTLLNILYKCACFYFSMFKQILPAWNIQWFFLHLRLNKARKKRNLLNFNAIEFTMLKDMQNTNKIIFHSKAIKFAWHSFCALPIQPDSAEIECMLFGKTKWVRWFNFFSAYQIWFEEVFSASSPLLLLFLFSHSRWKWILNHKYLWFMMKYNVQQSHMTRGGKQRTKQKKNQVGLTSCAKFLSFLYHFCIYKEGVDILRNFELAEEKCKQFGIVYRS